jgi:hypothetical protein
MKKTWWIKIINFTKIRIFLLPHFVDAKLVITTNHLVQQTNWFWSMSLEHILFLEF